MKKNEKILIVDDNPTNIEILEEIFDDFDLHVASTGEEALAIIDDIIPRLILLDIMMPGIDGCEVCRQIKSDPKLKHIKVVMVSSKAMDAERQLGYKAGADDYVTKPFKGKDLLAKVQEYL